VAVGFIVLGVLVQHAAAADEDPPAKDEKAKPDEDEEPEPKAEEKPKKKPPAKPGGWRRLFGRAA
jgi:hypothetical protein